jgi:hypothetical protein
MVLSSERHVALKCKSATSARYVDGYRNSSTCYSDHGSRFEGHRKSSSAPRSLSMINVNLKMRCGRREGGFHVTPYEFHVVSVSQARELIDRNDC